VCEFSDSRFVEVLARCCRVWLDKRTLDPDAIKLAEKVIQAGITQLPKDPFMVILYSTFLMDVQSSYQSGYTQLQVSDARCASALFPICFTCTVVHVPVTLPLLNDCRPPARWRRPSCCDSLCSQGSSSMCSAVVAEREVTELTWFRMLSCNETTGARN
jgi:hypothetical protein